MTIPHDSFSAKERSAQHWFDQFTSLKTAWEAHSSTEDAHKLICISDRKIQEFITKIEVTTWLQQFGYRAVQPKREQCKGNVDHIYACFRKAFGCPPIIEKAELDTLSYTQLCVLAEKDEEHFSIISHYCIERLQTMMEDSQLHKLMLISGYKNPRKGYVEKNILTLLKHVQACFANATSIITKAFPSYTHENDDFFQHDTLKKGLQLAYDLNLIYVLSSYKTNRIQYSLETISATAQALMHDTEVLEKIYTQQYVVICGTLSMLPSEITMFQNLESLCLANNKLKSIPELTTLSQLRVVDFSQNQLDHFPNDLPLEQLTELHLGCNTISSLGADLGRCLKLQQLNLHNNKLRSLPDDLRKLQQLQELSLERNKLTRFPNTIKKLVSLTSLHIDGNAITAIPDVMRKKFFIF